MVIYIFLNFIDGIHEDNATCPNISSVAELLLKFGRICSDVSNFTWIQKWMCCTMLLLMNRVDKIIHHLAIIVLYFFLKPDWCFVKWIFQKASCEIFMKQNDGKLHESIEKVNMEIQLFLRLNSDYASLSVNTSDHSKMYFKSQSGDIEANLKLLAKSNRRFTKVMKCFITCHYYVAGCHGGTLKQSVLFR